MAPKRNNAQQDVWGPGVEQPFGQGQFEGWKYLVKIDPQNGASPVWVHALGLQFAFRKASCTHGYK